MSEVAVIARYFGSYIIDAVVRESHATATRITDNPVETGSVVSDHAYDDPDRITIEGAVTDIPFGAFADYYRTARDGGGLSSPDWDAFGGSGEGRPRAAWKLLRALQATHEPFTVQTGLKLYTDMLIERLEADQDVNTAGALYFRAELRQVVIVSTQVVVVPPRIDEKTERGYTPKIARGEQTGEAKAATAPTTNTARSVLSRMPEWLREQSGMFKSLGLGG